MSIWSIIIACVLVAGLILGLSLMIIANPNNLRDSWQQRVYCYIFEHDDYALWKYVNSRSDDIEFVRTSSLNNISERDKVYYFSLAIPEYKTLNLKSKDWKRAVKWWDEGHEPVLDIIMWPVPGDEPIASIHWADGCLAGEFYYDGSREMAETLQEKLCELQDYES